MYWQSALKCSTVSISSLTLYSLSPPPSLPPMCRVQTGVQLSEGTETRGSDRRVPRCVGEVSYLPKDTARDTGQGQTEPQSVASISLSFLSLLTITLLKLCCNNAKTIDKQ